MATRDPFDAVYDWFISHRVKLAGLVGFVAGLLATLLPFYSQSRPMQISIAVFGFLTTALSAGGAFNTDRHNAMKTAIDQGKVIDRREESGRISTIWLMISLGAIALVLFLFLSGCAKKPPAPPVVDPLAPYKQVCHNHRTLDLTGAEVWEHLRDHVFDYAGPCRPRSSRSPSSR